MGTDENYFNCTRKEWLATRERVRNTPGISGDLDGAHNITTYVLGPCPSESLCVEAADVLEASLAAMKALGDKWRGDWSDFDGRTLRDQLAELDELIRAEVAGEDVTDMVAGFYIQNDLDSTG